MGVSALIAAVPGAAVAAPDPIDPGKLTAGTVTSNGDQYRYVLYTPASYAPHRPTPLVVVVHGCETTAEQQLKASLYDPVADREGAVVLYPDVDAAGRSQPGPLNQCWKFWEPQAWNRGGGDAAAIADMTGTVMAKMNIDSQRVYLIGMSAGGLMASIEAAAYPDLYAAVGISAASAYTDWTCLATGVGIPAATSAQLAFDQMGPRARVVPIFVIGGDADQAFPPTCTAKALEQGLRTDNLVISRGASQDGPISLAPAAVRQGQQPGGHAYTVSTYHDPSGCLIGERWLIHGMNHFWSGGTTDPRYASFTDPKGSSAAEASWAFFERYRKSDTAMPCAETAVPYTPPPVICAGRPVTITLPPGMRARRVLAWVDGRRVRAKLGGRRVTLTLPPGPKRAARIMVRVRRDHRSPVQVLRRSVARC